MNPIGYHYYFANRMKPSAASRKHDAVPENPSAVADAGRDHDMALGVLLMTLVVGLPVLLVAIFTLLFRV